MNYFDIPNLPEGLVKLAIVDSRIDKCIEENLITRGVSLIKTKQHKNVYEAISCHPDIMLHHLGGRNMVYAPGTHEDVLTSLSDMGFMLIEGSTQLTEKYPLNIAYNVARVGKYAFHNLKYTDRVLKEKLLEMGVELVHVNQGYSKCSISIVTEDSIITSDMGISKAAKEKGIEVLSIEADENICLPGLSCGFIGGSTGLLGKNLWAITGSIEILKSADKIRKFLSNKGVSIVELRNGQIIDIGSILPILTDG